MTSFPLPFYSSWAPEVILHNAAEEKFIYRQVKLPPRTLEINLTLIIISRWASFAKMATWFTWLPFIPKAPARPILKVTMVKEESSLLISKHANWDLARGSTNNIKSSTAYQQAREALTWTTSVVHPDGRSWPQRPSWNPFIIPCSTNLRSMSFSPFPPKESSSTIQSLESCGRLWWCNFNSSYIVHMISLFQEEEVNNRTSSSQQTSWQDQSDF